MTLKKLVARLVLVVFGLILWVGMGNVVAKGIINKPDFPYDILIGMASVVVFAGIILGFIWAAENA